MNMTTTATTTSTTTPKTASTHSPPQKRRQHSRHHSHFNGNLNITLQLRRALMFSALQGSLLGRPAGKVLLFFIRPAGKAIIIIFLFSAVSRPQEVSLQHLIIITGNIEVNVSRKLQIKHPTSLRPRVLTNLGGLDGIPLWIAGTMPQPLRNAHSNMPRLVSRYLIAIYCLA